MITVSPSGDITGATDVAAINAALVTDDVQLTAGGQYYVQPDASGVAISMPNSRTLQGADASNKSRILMTNTLSATFVGSMITGTGSGLAKSNTVKNLYLDGGRARVRYTPSSANISFTSGTKTITDANSSWLIFGFSAGMTIVVGGTVSNNGTYTIASVSAGSIVVNETLVTEGALTTTYVRQVETGANNILNGACISLAGQNAYGSNAIAITDVECVNGPIQAISINSIDGITFTRVTTSADRPPVQSGHGNDFDAVAVDKPSKNIAWVDSDLDAYGNESVKYENSNDITHTNTIFRTYISLTQDSSIPYADLKNISFTGCTFYSYVGMSYLKRQHIAGRDTTQYNPTMGLTLGSAGVSSGETAGVTITAASGTPFATSIFGGNGPVGCMIVATESGITGAALITARTSDTVVTATIVNKFADTSVAANTWEFSQTNNSGTGNVTFTTCTFSGDDACIRGNDNSGVNYGTITATGCTFTGRNSHFFPTAYIGFRPTLTTCTGVSSVPTLWVTNVANLNPKIVNVSGTGGIFPSIVKTLGNTTAVSAISNIASVLYDGFDFTNARITFVNDTYTFASGFITGFTNGNVNIPLSVEAETQYLAIIDGTGSTGSFMGLTGTNNRLITISGFYIKNFTGNTSSRGITLNAATAVGRIVNNYFYNCNTISNGGCGIRVQNAQSCVIDGNTFDSCYSTTAGNGVAILSAITPTIVRGNLIKNCISNGTSSGMIMVQATAAGESYVTGNVIVGCSGAGSVGIAVSNSTVGAVLNVFNNAIYNIYSISTNNDISVFVNNASTTCNMSNNIGYSPTQTATMSKSGAGVLNYGDNCSAVAISATGGTNNNLGGNILTNPGFTNTTYLTIGTTSPCYQTGVLLTSPLSTMIRDKNGRPFRNPSSMGAYEIRTSGGPATDRSIATSRAIGTRTLRTATSSGGGTIRINRTTDFDPVA